MLLAMLINTEALEIDVSSRTELRLDWTRDIDGRLHAQLRDTALHHSELDSDNTSHLNRATERNLAVTLREMQITDTELRALDVDGKEHLTATGKVLDIAVPAMFGSTRDRSRAFLADFFLDIARCAACVDVLRLWGLRYDTVKLVRCDEFAFSAVPLGENFGGWCAPEDTRVDQACETNAGDVARGAEDAFEVPYSLRAARRACQPAPSSLDNRPNSRFWVDLIQETTAIALIEHARKAPRLFLHRLNILDLD